jgi:hypothetical protein
MADLGQTPMGATTEYEDSSLEKWLKADEAEKLTPVEHPPPTLPPVVVPEPTPGEIPPSTPGEPPSPESPSGEPAAPPAAVEAQPPAAPDAEVDPDADPDEAKPQKRPTWKQLREIERELKTEREARLRLDQERSDGLRRQGEIEAELRMIRNQMGNRETQPPAETPVPLADETDPLTKVEREMAELRARDQQREAQSQTAALIQEINNQENSFQSSNPNGKHYRDAVVWWQENEIREAEKTGKIAVVTENVIRSAQQAERAGQGNFVRQAAMQYGRSEREVAEAMAKNAIVSSKRDEIVISSRLSGRNVAESLWEIAQMRGYRPATAAAPPSPAAPPPPPRNPVELREASRSLSSVPPSPPPPATRTIRSRQELLDIPSEELGRYIDEMDRTAPGWLERLG